MAKTSFNCPDSREIVSFCVNLQRGHKTDVIFHNLQEEGNVGHQDIPSVRRCCCMLAQTAAAGELHAQAQPSHARHFCGEAGMGALQPGLTRLTLKSHFSGLRVWEQAASVKGNHSDFPRNSDTQQAEWGRWLEAILTHRWERPFNASPLRFQPLIFSWKLKKIEKDCNYNKQKHLSQSDTVGSVPVQTDVASELQRTNYCYHWRYHVFVNSPNYIFYLSSGGISVWNRCISPPILSFPGVWCTVFISGHRESLHSAPPSKTLWSVTGGGLLTIHPYLSPSPGPGWALVRSVGAALGTSTTRGALPGSSLPSTAEPPHRRKARKFEWRTLRF